MWVRLKDFSLNLLDSIPQTVFEGTASVFWLGLVVFVVRKGFKTGLRYTAALLLMEYIFLLFCSTIVCRVVDETIQYDFHPLWSYKAIQDGREDIFVENLMNIFVFIPVGLLLSVVFKQMKWWIALLIGCGISITIETLQFFLMRGFSEFDDVMHNTLGCLIGFGFMMILRIIFKTRYNNV